jgi:ribosomal protein S18 acetylase RimI-like enzyme
MTSLTSHSGRVITLRSPQEGDETILFDYITKLGQEDTYILVNPAEMVTYTEESDYLKSILKKIAANWQVHYLAFHESRMIGACQITVKGRRKMHVGDFGISLLIDFRGDGIGKQLAQFVLNEAITKMQLKLITLEVFPQNTAAQNLYRSLGFIEYGRLPQGLKYKDNFHDAILMYKNLNEA